MIYRAPVSDRRNRTTLSREMRLARLPISSSTFVPSIAVIPKGPSATRVRLWIALPGWIRPRRRDTKDPDLKAFSVRSYLFLEPILVFYLLSEQMSASAVYQVATLEVPTMKIHTVRLARNTFRASFHNNFLSRLKLRYCEWVQFVILWIHVLYPNVGLSVCKSQFLRCFSTLWPSAAIILRLYCSNCPLVYGWFVVGSLFWCTASYTCAGKIPKYTACKYRTWICVSGPRQWPNGLQTLWLHTWLL